MSAAVFDYTNASHYPVPKEPFVIDSSTLENHLESLLQRQPANLRNTENQMSEFEDTMPSLRNNDRGKSESDDCGLQDTGATSVAKNVPQTSVIANKVPLDSHQTELDASEGSRQVIKPAQFKTTARRIRSRKLDTILELPQSAPKRSNTDAKHEPSVEAEMDHQPDSHLYKLGDLNTTADSPDKTHPMTPPSHVPSSDLPPKPEPESTQTISPSRTEQTQENRQNEEKMFWDMLQENFGPDKREDGKGFRPILQVVPAKDDRSVREKGGFSSTTPPPLPFHTKNDIKEVQEKRKPNAQPYPLSSASHLTPTSPIPSINSNLPPFSLTQSTTYDSGKTQASEQPDKTNHPPPTAPHPIPTSPEQILSRKAKRHAKKRKQSSTPAVVKNDPQKLREPKKSETLPPHRNRLLPWIPSRPARSQSRMTYSISADVPQSEKLGKTGSDAPVETAPLPPPPPLYDIASQVPQTSKTPSPPLPPLPNPPRTPPTPIPGLESPPISQPPSTNVTQTIPDLPPAPKEHVKNADLRDEDDTAHTLTTTKSPHKDSETTLPFQPKPSPPLSSSPFLDEDPKTSQYQDNARSGPDMDNAFEPANFEGERASTAQTPSLPSQPGPSPFPFLFPDEEPENAQDQYNFRFTPDMDKVFGALDLEAEHVSTPSVPQTPSQPPQIEPSPSGSPSSDREHVQGKEQKDTQELYKGSGKTSADGAFENLDCGDEHVSMPKSPTKTPAPSQPVLGGFTSPPPSAGCQQEHEQEQEQEQEQEYTQEQVKGYPNPDVDNTSETPSRPPSPLLKTTPRPSPPLHTTPRPPPPSTPKSLSNTKTNISNNKLYTQDKHENEAEYEDEPFNPTTPPSPWETTPTPVVYKPVSGGGFWDDIIVPSSSTSSPTPSSTASEKDDEEKEKDKEEGDKGDKEEAEDSSKTFLIAYWILWGAWMVLLGSDSVPPP